jgi:putative protein kinase ArgK-like GTPase of G3E family
MVLLPRGWNLYSVFVFEMTRASQVGIAESIASILCGSYDSTGGFNATQAGISKAGVLNLTDAEWTEIIFKMMPRRVWTNMEHYTAIIKAFTKKTADRARQIEDDEKYKESVPEMVRLVSDINQGTDRLEEKVNETTATLKKVQREVDERREKREALQIAEESLVKLSDYLGSLLVEDE